MATAYLPYADASMEVGRELRCTMSGVVPAISRNKQPPDVWSWRLRLLLFWTAQWPRMGSLELLILITRS
jgi:hypothetical protein